MCGVFPPMQRIVSLICDTKEEQAVPKQTYNKVHLLLILSSAGKGTENAGRATAATKGKSRS